MSISNKYSLVKLKYLTIGLLIGIFSASLVSSTFAIANSPIKLIINGQQIQCDVPPQNINGRIFVPVRFVAENLGTEVNWDEINNSVIITSKKQGNIVTPPVNTNNNVIITPEADNPKPYENTQPLRLDSISETTYKPIKGTDYKKAYVTVVITNNSDKYIPFIRLNPIINIDDGRNYDSALDESVYEFKDYFKPNSTITLTYWTQIPNEINILNWQLP